MTLCAALNPDASPGAAHPHHPLRRRTGRGAPAADRRSRSRGSRSPGRLAVRPDAREHLHLRTAGRLAASTTSSARSDASSPSTVGSAPGPAASTSSSPVTMSPSASGGVGDISRSSFRCATRRRATHGSTPASRSTSRFESRSCCREMSASEETARHRSASGSGGGHRRGRCRDDDRPRRHSRRPRANGLVGGPGGAGDEPVVLLPGLAYDDDHDHDHYDDDDNDNNDHYHDDVPRPARRPPRLRDRRALDDVDFRPPRQQRPCRRLRSRRRTTTSSSPTAAYTTSAERSSTGPRPRSHRRATSAAPRPSTAPATGWRPRGGNVYRFGDARLPRAHRCTSASTAPIVAIAAAPVGEGYWLVPANGAIYSYGTAAFCGSLVHRRLPSPIVGFSASPDDGGYRLVAANGSVYGFGDVNAHGSPPQLNRRQLGRRHWPRRPTVTATGWRPHRRRLPLRRGALTTGTSPKQGSRPDRLASSPRPTAPATG